MNASWEADKDEAKSEYVLDQQGHNDTENSQDECGPFCSCACCGTVLIMPFGEQIGKALITLPSSYIFSYEFNYSFEYSEGVWHPPICV